MLTGADLRNRIDTFLVKAKMAPTRFGKDAVGDPSFVFDIREGRVPSLDTANRVIEFIERHCGGTGNQDAKPSRRSA